MVHFEHICMLYKLIILNSSFTSTISLLSSRGGQKSWPAALPNIIFAHFNDSLILLADGIVSERNQVSAIFPQCELLSQRWRRREKWLSST